PYTRLSRSAPAFSRTTSRAAPGSPASTARMRAADSGTDPTRSVACDAGSRPAPAAGACHPRLSPGAGGRSGNPPHPADPELHHVGGALEPELVEAAGAVHHP